MIFAKAPVAGQVKTRLIPALNPEQAAKLQEQFTVSTLQKATQASLVSVELWCAPDANHNFFKECEQQFTISLHTQSGNDLGKRMENAFLDTLEHAGWAIIIGTDCPELSTEDLDLAMQKLEDGNEVVIQPAHDGGYVLIGLKNCRTELFTNIDWGTSRVFEQTRERLNNLGQQCMVLDARQDIDRPEDLKYLNSELF